MRCRFAVCEVKARPSTRMRWQKNILDGEKRKNCFVRAITTINHRRFGDELRVSTVFSVGI